jgi:hypothetical protein
MSFATNTNMDHLTRSQVWSSQIKEVLEEELFAMKYVDMITDFPDGDTINIPSIGQQEVYDYEEGQAIRYTAMDTGNFTFTITEYKASATYITNKAKQDSFYFSRLVSSFVPKQARVISESMEIDALSVGPDGQTASNLNVINGANHRFVGSGTNQKIALKDFALAKYALRKALVPMTNLVAIVDPSVEYEIGQLSLNNYDANPRWDRIAAEGVSTGMKFITNIQGFDVYTSDFLKRNVNETIDSKTTTSGVANLFFSASRDVVPFVGSIRQYPKVDSDYNKDLQREEYVTTARWGMKLYRPENLVTVITDDDQVS